MSRLLQIILSLCLLSITVLAGMVSATQYVAHGLSYHPSLSGALFSFGEIIFYQPWMFWEWRFKFQGHYTDIFNIAYMIQVVCVAIGFIGVLIVKRFGGDPVQDVKPFGEDAWGTIEDAKKAKLVGNKDGVVLGRIEDEILKHAGAEHVLVTGAPRSGKGVGIVIPSLWNWMGSAIVYDPKEELWALTAGHRSKRGEVLYYNPICMNSVRINPLLSVRKGVSEIGDIQNIVQFLSNPDATQQQRNIWEESGKRLVTAVILHVLYAEEDGRKNLAVVREKILDLDKTLKEMMRTPHRLNKETGEPEVHPEVMRVAKAIYSKYKKFRESVSGTAETYLELWADEVIARSTSANDFNVSDFMYGEKPLTLYLRFPYSDRERLMPLIKYTLSQMLRGIIRQGSAYADRSKTMHSTLLCLEEFPTLGKMSFLETDLGVVTGYGLKALLVTQSSNAIEKEYGNSTTIFDNCYVQVCFASADPKTQKRMSQMAGQVTEIRESVNQQKDKYGWKRGSAVSYSESTRPILTEGQARELDEDKQIIFIGSTKPLKTDKIRYYDYEHLDQLKDIPPPKENVLTDFTPSHDWIGERAKGKLLPMPDIKIERESGEELQDDMVIKAEKLKLHDMIHSARKKEEGQGLDEKPAAPDEVILDDDMEEGL